MIECGRRSQQRACRRAAPAARRPESCIRRGASDG